MQKFQDLEVWRLGHSLVLQVYKATASFPDNERYGLVSQLRRAAGSVPTNIAEGSKKLSGKDYAKFLNIAEGSLAETEYLLILAQDLGYVVPDWAKERSDEVSLLARKLFRLRSAVMRSAKSAVKQPRP